MVEPPKPVKKDFVPDESFTWDFDLNASAGVNKKKHSDHEGFAVIRSEGAASYEGGLNQNLKVKLKNNIEFSLTNLDKICTKGFTNNSNCCFMNVCLQSLLSSPPFFNMLVKIGED